MKRLFGFALIILFIAGPAYAKDYEITKQAGSYSVTVKLDKKSPVLGDNGISIMIKDASGKIVKDAKVIVYSEMPAMPGMPAMRYKSQTVLKGDSYVGMVNFSMAGSWTLNIKIARSGKTDSVKLTVDVS
jgi:hypothetical protein